MEVQAYPSYFLYYPKLQFQMNMALVGLPIDQFAPEWITSRSSEWKRLGVQSNLISLDKENFEEEVNGYEDLWIIMFTGGSRNSKVHCDSARMNMVRLSANLRGLAQVGVVDCNSNLELCIKEFKTVPTTFPLFRVYSRGAVKTSEELFNFRSVPVHVACEMIEKLVQMLMANEKICKDGVCSAVTQAFQETYEAHKEEPKEDEKPPHRGYQDPGNKARTNFVDGKRPNLLQF
eukprot:TRINITY_DN10096_c0_g2_i4.p1 TRINITY_DN10096_c0_g2~~TRINITY_DN10096_c0_g2_i4.p1  ORF type:complete len:233 (-),score=39.29 TRINITY_DN10096_c0_g2_i4:91-789(-)